MSVQNDLNPDTYIGLSFPLGFAGNRLFNRTKTLAQQAEHNLRNLLLTNLGERPMQPEFGSRLMEVIFETEPTAMVEEVINEAVVKWLPYISITDISSNFDNTNPHMFNVSISFSVSSSPGATNQVVLDFNASTTG